MEYKLKRWIHDSISREEGADGKSTKTSEMLRTARNAIVSLEDELKGLKKQIGRIADDYIPDNEQQASQALAEMREALFEALLKDQIATKEMK